MENITRMRSAFKDKFNNNLTGDEGKRLKLEWEENLRAEEE